MALGESVLRVVGNLCNSLANHFAVFSSPTSIGTDGSQASSLFASVMSGRRRTGSSWGSSRYTTAELDPVRLTTSLASSATRSSVGLPRLTGPAAWESSMASKARTMSSI